MANEPLTISVQSVRSNFYTAYYGRLIANRDGNKQPQVPYEPRNPKQNKVVDLVRTQFDKGRQEMLNDQLLLILQGEAGKDPFLDLQLSCNEGNSHNSLALFATILVVWRWQLFLQ